MYREYIYNTAVFVDTKVLFRSVVVGLSNVKIGPGNTDYGQTGFRLQQTQRAGTGYRFGAPLYLQFVKNFPIMSFNSIQSEKKLFANLFV